MPQVAPINTYSLQIAPYGFVILLSYGACPKNETCAFSERLTYCASHKNWTSVHQLPLQITVSLALGAVHDAEADVADPVFVRSTIALHGGRRRGVRENSRLASMERASPDACLADNSLIPACGPRSVDLSDSPDLGASLFQVLRLKGLQRQSSWAIADPPILSSSTRNGSWRYGSCGTGHLLVKRSGKQLLSTNLRRPIGSPTATSVQNRDPSFS